MVFLAIVVLILVGAALFYTRRSWAEYSHHLAIVYLRFCPLFLIRSYKPSGAKPLRCFDIDFDHSVGLAAGFDKQAHCLDALQKIGFAFVEVGGVTPRPQKGNPRPRVFRLSQDRAVINRYGLNSEGVDCVLKRLECFQSTGMKVGVNIAPNSDTPEEGRLNDFSVLFEKLYPVVDYFTVNLSCPNTSHQLDQSERATLRALLSGLQAQVQQQAALHQQKRPVLIKIGPDLPKEAREDLIQLIQQHGFDGVVAVNTMVARPDSLLSHYAAERGGLSGLPLYSTCLETVRAIDLQTNSQLPIVAVGGIDSASKIEELSCSGASLFQLYTAFVYHGGSLLKDLL